MKFPYGVSDFYQVITENYFYLDRTDRIGAIEEAGKQLLFLRPRRFGKSLLLSMLENYYDIAKASEFERLFGHLSIGKAPTLLHNQYLVLKWDLAVVDSFGKPEQVKQTLHRYVNSRIQDFAVKYRHLLPVEIQIEPVDAIVSFQSLLTAVQQTPHRIYLLIDEYDNFANEMMMGSRETSQERYESLLYGEGSLKTLFKAVKSAGTGMGLDRAFIAGVSPVVLSDITSGYNIAENIYLRPDFNDLCGFCESEIADTLRQIAADCGFSAAQADEALMMMRTFYNGYRFSERAKELVYNPTLALYFMKFFQRECRYPSEMLDSNLAMDRGKIAYISRLPGGGQLILDAVNQAPPISIPRLARRFGVEDVLYARKDTRFMASLLYYFGVLTMGDRSPFGKLFLHIPNMVVRRLYAERIREMLLPDVTRDAAERATELLYSVGDMQPLCDFVEQHYFKVFDNRDYRWANELTIKTAFLTLLFNDVLYMVDSEAALERGYADLVLILRPEARQYQLLDILIEFKYVGLKKVGLGREKVRKMSLDELMALGGVQEKLDQAAAQLENYRRCLKTRYGERLRLRAFTVIALGFERLVWQEIP